MPTHERSTLTLIELPVVIPLSPADGGDCCFASGFAHMVSRFE